MNLEDAAPVAAALVLAAGVVTLIASGSPDPATQPAPAVVTTAAPAGTGPTHLAPRCFETSAAGAEDCAWIPVAACLSDEDGDDAIPASYDGCYWDANARGNRTGAGYVIWRQNRG